MTGKDLDLDVAECLARVHQQDEDAARLLVEYLYPTVIRVVRANLPRRQQEEDLAQDIFAVVFAKLRQYRGKVPLEHWVSRIAVNHCLNAFRYQRGRPEWRMSDLSEEQNDALEAVSMDPAPEPHPAQRLAARELVDLLLEHLSPADRLVIRLLEIEELPLNRVQELTGWSTTYIRVRAFRARRRLNQRYEKLRKNGHV